MKTRDILLLLGGIAIVTFLWLAPEETTSPVPHDEIHEPYYDIVRAEGKKAAEVFCVDCHNPDDIPLSEDHPPTFRCLFCHKVNK